jgi:peroxiredoxin
MYKIFLNYLISIVLLFIFFPGCNTGASGYSIRVNLKGSTNADSLYLSRLENSKPLIIQTIRISSGKAILKGKLPLKPGMYTAGIGQKVKFDFFVSDTLHQHFNMSADIGNILSSLTFENSRENTAFSDYQRFLDDCGNQQKALQLRMRHNNWSPDSVNKINNSFSQLNERMEYQAAMLKKSFPGSMLALYIGLILDPHVPEPVIPVTVNDKQQFMQEYYFQYVSGHFFDNFDFSDPRIISIPIFEKKTGFYFRQMVPPLTDSVMVKVETLLERTGKNDDVRNFTVKYLYRLFRESANPEFMQISNLIGENFILPDPDRWKDELFVEKVRERISKENLNAPGTVATDLKLETNSGETIKLSEVKAMLTILYFFNPDCDACGPITDQLYPVYKKFKNKGVEVFAVYLDRKKESWEQYISSKGLKWINVFDPTGEEQIEKKYDIYAIPMIYLLDQNKRIIRKDIPVNDLEKLLGER